MGNLDINGQNKPKDEKRITVKINNKAVVFELDKANGLQIKQTAIAQGVPNIAEDFSVLQRAGNSGNFKPVGDNEEIPIHPNQEFRIVAPDDNS